MEMNNDQGGKIDFPLSNVSKEDVISLGQYVQKELELEEEAQAQLEEDWGDEEHCTFDAGYKTQPIYSCETCMQNKETKEPFGFCFGCSMNCHVDHKVFELFDKRDFRCDCGTPKSGCSCQLETQQSKTQSNNEKNQYNHNFEGKYCWCDGHYDESQMVMYSCTMCLDWFHIECIRKKETVRVPEPEEPCDFVCDHCMSHYQSILEMYADTLLLPSTLPLPAKRWRADQTTIHHPSPSLPSPSPSSSDQVSPSLSSLSPSTAAAAEVVDTSSSSNNTNNNNNTVIQTTTTIDKSDTNSILCLCKDKQHPFPFYSQIVNGFWQKDWRKHLCHCNDCKSRYASLHCEFLLNEDELNESHQEEEEEGEEQQGEAPHTRDDSIGIKSNNNNNNNNNENQGSQQQQEEKKKRQAVSLLESSQEAFLRAPMPHEQRINLLQGYNDLKNHLTNQLKSFAESGKEVTKEDVLNIFAEIQQQKKRKL